LRPVSEAPSPGQGWILTTRPGGDGQRAGWYDEWEDGKGLREARVNMEGGFAVLVSLMVVVMVCSTNSIRS
jgi:hypothetical protein